jgi:hypothetical protein
MIFRQAPAHPNADDHVSAGLTMLSSSASYPVRALPMSRPMASGDLCSLSGLFNLYGLSGPNPPCPPFSKGGCLEFPLFTKGGRSGSVPCTKRESLFFLPLYKRGNEGDFLLKRRLPRLAILRQAQNRCSARNDGIIFCLHSGTQKLLSLSPVIFYFLFFA